MLRLSNLDAFRGMTFESFDPKVTGVRRAYLQGREYAEAMHGWLMSAKARCSALNLLATSGVTR